MRLLVFLLPVIAAAADFTGFHQQSIALAAGETVEVYAGLPQPSQLPANGRIAVEWAGYRKVIHAHDPDFYLVYRAPKAAAYTLKLTKVEDEEPIFNRPRWRETGTVEKLTAYPKLTPWPTGHKVALRTKLARLNPGASTRGMVLEAEPNDALTTAQNIDFNGRDTIHITGGADDAEYFDNGLIGSSGLDYFRIHYTGATPRLFTANLALPILSSSPSYSSTPPTAKSTAPAPTPTNASTSKPNPTAPPSPAPSSPAASTSSRSKPTPPATKSNSASATSPRTPIPARPSNRLSTTTWARSTPGSSTAPAAPPSTAASATPATSWEPTA